MNIGRQMYLHDPWKTPRIYWKPHEDIWILAANTLPLFDRYAAYRDIAAITGYDYERVLDKSRKIRHAGKHKIPYGWTIAAE